MRLKNWKTSVAGIAALVGVFAKVVTTGKFDWVTDGPIIVTALGLLTAKDFDVSHTQR